MTDIRSTAVLGLSERWSLARNLIGSPIIVIYHATLSKGLVSPADLDEAMSTLVTAYPILSHAVQSPHSNSPSYQHSPSISTSNIVEILPLDPDTTHTQLVEKAHYLGFGFDVENGPLIRVQLHQSDDSTRRDSLVMFFDHIICDGLGGRNLFTDLLTLLSGSTIVPSPAGLPIRMDDTVDLFTQIVSTPSPPPNYPTTMPDYNPRTSAQILRDITLPHDILTNLLTVGKSHSVPTLQSILHTSALVALYHANGSTSPLVIKTSTPISERNEAHGHPRSTGNYVIFHYANTPITPITSFWDQAREYSANLRYPTARINARAALGTFGRLPEVSSVGDGRTGWDEHMDELVERSNGKERLAIAVSNVGRMELPVDGKLVGKVEDVYFAQSASAVGAAIVMSIISYNGGPLTISFCSKEGSLEDGVLDRFIESLGVVLRIVASGQVDEGSDMRDLLGGGKGTQ